VVNGIKPTIPSAGDRISVSFVNGDIHAPQITNIYPPERSTRYIKAKCGSETSKMLAIF
jgi:hypothetical protein